MPGADGGPAEGLAPFGVRAGPPGRQHAPYTTVVSGQRRAAIQGRLTCQSMYIGADLPRAREGGGTGAPGAGAPKFVPQVSVSGNIEYMILPSFLSKTLCEFLHWH